MQRFILLTLLIFSGLLAKGQDIEVIKIEQLEALLGNTDGKDRVINFWATWCKPCIVEMPHFEKIQAKYKERNVEVILVSLDFVENIDRVKKFVERKGIRSKVLLLDEIDYNSWIDKVDESWSGAIPATIIVNAHAAKSSFYEKEFKAGELEKTVIDFIN